jgi:hypothetical protein
MNIHNLTNTRDRWFIVTFFHLHGNSLFADGTGFTIEIYDFFRGHCNYRHAASVKEFNLLYVQKRLLIKVIKFDYSNLFTRGHQLAHYCS